MAENEALRQVSAISSSMARTLALLLVAVLAPQQCSAAMLSGAAASDNELHRHRGQRLRHGHHHGHHFRALPVEQISSEDGVTILSEDGAKEDASEAPLYDDFLDIMDNAAAKALSQQRAVPAYDDFLHFMKNSVEKAHKEQVGKPSYDDFLGFVKGKTDEAYQQMGTPSYDDFLTALKVSSTEALKEPVPSYEQFLATLKDAATAAMQKRVHGDEPTDTVEAFKMENSDNPFEHVKNGFRKAKNQMQGKNEKDDGSKKLRRELRELKRQQKRHEEDGTAPPHAKRPIMKRINVLRTTLCWQRPNLWKHKKCLRFLGLHCMQESTGEGICREFTRKATKRCKKCEATKKCKKHLKEDYCALSEALGDTYGDEEEEEEEEEQEEEEVLSDDDEHDDEHDEGEDKDGVGSDDDIDHENEEMDKELSEHEDEAKEADGPGGPPKIQPRIASDRDGDGVTDDKDAFPDDPNEWKDIDKDGKGDNADTDDDGDGIPDKDDASPSHPKDWKDLDGDGIGDDEDDDRDGDGVANDKDKFPDDPAEWFDSDGDGHGDNSDAHPFNPNCHDHVLPCVDLEGAKKPKPGSAQDPTTLDMDAKRGLPTQGYSEHSPGAPVTHKNYYTWVGDWQREFPDMPESEKSTMSRICKEHPDNSWCMRFANRDAHFR